MEDRDEFDLGHCRGEQPGLFGIEVADGDRGRFFTVRPLGQGRYELLEDQCIVGTIQLDKTDQAHAERKRCELELPLLHGIREQVSQHIQLGELRAKFLELYGSI